jgi:signal transduction histidine kinase
VGAATPGERSTRSLHLLLVDDSDADRTLVEVMLRRVRGDLDRLTPASNAAAACRALGAHDDIDLVLLDLRLPDSQGIETVRRVVEAAPDVPVIVLTEADDEEIGRTCVAAGAQDYLPKSELRAMLLGRVIEYAVTRSRDSAARRKLEQEVLESSEHERQRIARDLHDDLGQQLTGIAIMARALATKLAVRALPEANDARELGELVQDAIGQSVALARGLDPLTEFGAALPMALEGLAQDGERRFRIRCAFRASEVPSVDGTVASHLFRIAQEAITNAVKHASARRVDIELRGAGGALELVITDDGKSTVDPATFRSGQGLRIMAYRARSIGAALAIERGPNGHGLQVRCTLPAV